MNAKCGGNRLENKSIFAKIGEKVYKYEPLIEKQNSR
jgi:hypothetical protein